MPWLCAKWLAAARPLSVTRPRCVRYVQVWVNLADRVGVEALKRTTRDEPNYDTLMKYRLDIMKKEGLGIQDINAAIESMDPLPGAVEMVAWLRERFQVIILSDTFYEFGMVRAADFYFICTLHLPLHARKKPKLTD